MPLKSSGATVHPGTTTASVRPSVCHIINGLGTGGAETMLFKLLTYMPDTWSASVISLRDTASIGARLAARGTRVQALGIHGSFPTPQSTMELFRAVRSLDPDVLQGWMYHGNLAAWIARQLYARSTPLVWNIRHSLTDSSDVKAGTRMAIRLGARLSKGPERIVYNSHTSAAQHEAVGYDASRTVVIPNGFDTALFAPSASVRADLRLRFDIPEAATVFGVVGRYHPVKGHHGFLVAAKQLLATHPDCLFMLVGAGLTYDNPDVMRIVRDLGLGAHVRLLGFEHEVGAIYPAFDIVCSPSRTEAFSNAIGEAMSCAIPCVVTDVGDSARIVADTGLVVPPRDPAALAVAMARFADMGAESRHTLGARARARVQANYSIETIGMRFAELYTSLLDSRGVRSSARQPAGPIELTQK